MGFEKGNQWGRVGGKAKTEAKKKSSKENGKKGGRPKYGADWAVEYYCQRRKRKILVFFKSDKSALRVFNKHDSPTMYFYLFERYKKITPPEYILQN